jgi:GNAT superfamily N-acetyltransferase
MVPTDNPQIIELDESHLNGALALSEEAHWNQIEADWRMMLTAGTGLGIEVDGRLVASALMLPYGVKFGWISMVLVAADWQKKGLATRLLNTCIEKLESMGLTPVLDATPAGENVYRPLGFRPHFGFQRWEHESAEEIQVGSSAVESVTLEDVIRIDADVFGGARRPIIESLVERSRTFSCEDKNYNGYLLGRDGRNASQIGPIFTANPTSAIEMLNHALSHLKGRVFIDACDHQINFIERLKEYSFKPQRPFLRMAKNDGSNFGAPVQMFAMAGPELG